MDASCTIIPLSDVYLGPCLTLWEAAGMMLEADMEARLRRLLLRQPVLSQVALVDERVGGVVLCSYNEFSASIFRLVVDPGLRNRGIGAGLMRAAEQAAAEAGATRVMLITQDPVASWCERQGYLRTSAHFLFKVLN